MDGRPRSASLRRVLRYRFDNLLARGTWAVLLWLFLATVVVVVVSALLLNVFGVTFSGSEDSSWLEDLWQSVLRTLDPGTMASDVGWGRRFLALAVTMFGILIAGTLIGIIAAGVEARVDQMQRGRSAVVESDHLVILGSPGRLPVIVEQLALAGRHRPGNTIVVLADSEPVEVGHELRNSIDDFYGSRLVIRAGDPTRPADLDRVAVGAARAIVVPAPDGVVDDASVVKSVIAARDRIGASGAPIVAEISDPSTADALARAMGTTVHPIVPIRSIARITAFSLRSPGLHQVVLQLLDFQGADVHVWPTDGLVGSSFADCVLSFVDARPIGVIDAGGAVELNPSPDRRVAADDRLIVVSDTDQPGPSIRQRSAPVVSCSPRDPEPPASTPLHVLVVGWNAIGRYMVEELAERCPAGSTIEIVVDPRLVDADQIASAAGDVEVTVTEDQALAWELGDTDTERLSAIVLLGYGRTSASDSRTLLNLTLLRTALDERGGHRPRVLTELLDPETVPLAESVHTSDIVVSDAMASRFMAQLAELPDRRHILLALYGGGGASLSLVAVDDLDVPPDPTFDDVLLAAYANGWLAIGWRRDPAVGGDVVLNPPLGSRPSLGAADRVIVIR